MGGGCDVPVRDPIATVVSVERRATGVRVELRVRGHLWPPLFPASLLRGEGDEALHLDRLAETKDDGALVFDTFDAPDPLVTEGDEYVFRPWWTPDALELVTDTSRRWTRERYPDDGGHDHCPLTWEAIAPYEGDGTGYRSGDDWISVSGYERYIRDDHLRVRGGPR